MAIDANSADQLIVLQHRDAEYRPIATEIDGGDDNGMAFDVGPYGLDVGNLDHLLRGGDTPKDRVRRRSEQFACARLDIRRRRIVGSNRAEAISLAEVQRAELGLANAHRVLQHGLEHRLQRAGRSGNDVQHFEGGGLPFQRFGKVLSRFREFASAFFELLLQIGARFEMRPPRVPPSFRSNEDH